MNGIDELLDENLSLLDVADRVLKDEKLFKAFDRMLTALIRKLKDDTGLQPQELSLLEFTLYVWDVKDSSPHAVVEMLRNRHESKEQ